jgi:hypothetical protein
MAGAPVARMRSASKLVCWSPSITATGNWGAVAQRFDGGAQQRGLARAGAGHQVQRRHAVRRKVRRLLRGDTRLLAQDVGFELDGTRLAHAGHRDPRRARAEVQVTTLRVHLHVAVIKRYTVRMCVRMSVVVAMPMFVPMRLAKAMRMHMPAHCRTTLARIGATTDHTHARSPSIVFDQHLHHAQLGAAGGLQLIAATVRAGIATLRDGHHDAAAQAPGRASGFINLDSRAFQAGAGGQRFQRKTQRTRLDTRQLPGFEPQRGDTRKAFAQGAVFHQLQDAAGQADFMHGRPPAAGVRHA